MNSGWGKLVKRCKFHREGTFEYGLETALVKHILYLDDKCMTALRLNPPTHCTGNHDQQSFFFIVSLIHTNTGKFNM